MLCPVELWRHMRSWGIEPLLLLGGQPCGLHTANALERLDRGISDFGCPAFRRPSDQAAHGLCPISCTIQDLHLWCGPSPIALEASPVDCLGNCALICHRRIAQRTERLQRPRILFPQWQFMRCKRFELLKFRLERNGLPLA